MSSRELIVFGVITLVAWPFLATWSLWPNAGLSCGLMAIVWFLFAIYVRIGEKR